MTHPGTGVSIIGWTLHDLPGTIAAQTRAYDGLPSDGGTAPLPNMEWYTPLMAWWLPQRTLLFGFAAAISVLLLVLAGATSNGPSWEPFALGGVLIGLLPIVHVQTLIALSILLFVLFWRRRRRDWLVLVGVAVVLGGIRLTQLVLAQHGAEVTPYGNNVYPWLEPGWMANAGTVADPSGRLALSIGNVFTGAIQALGMLGTARWWGFWLANLGVAVPLLAFVAIATATRLGGWKVGRMLTAAFPVPLLELALGALVIFAACNLVVFQTWNWDNTKLLVYWYLVIGLLIGALATHWWRRAWPRVAAVVLVAPVLLTGALVVLRLLPWTPPASAITGPYTIANTQELQLASTIDRVTPKGSVFLTFGRPNDPVLAVAGRIGVMGYGGWLWSYGISFETRFNDVQTMYNGCAADPANSLPGLQPAAASTTSAMSRSTTGSRTPARSTPGVEARRGGRIRDSRSSRAPTTSPSTTFGGRGADVTDERAAVALPSLDQRGAARVQRGGGDRRDGAAHGCRAHPARCRRFRDPRHR